MIREFVLSAILSTAQSTLIENFYVCAPVSLVTCCMICHGILQNYKVRSHYDMAARKRKVLFTWRLPTKGVPVSLHFPVSKPVQSRSIISFTQEASLIVICLAITTLFHLTVSMSVYILRIIII